jgi:hypothetical protein
LVRAVVISGNCAGRLAIRRSEQIAACLVNADG